MVTRIHKGARGHLYITEWRESLNLSVQQLADRLDVARETVWRWENEQNRLDPWKIAAIAEALGIEPEQLWRTPGTESIDAILKDASPDMRQTAADIVKRLIGKVA